MHAAAELSPTRRRWLLAAVMSGLLLAMLDQSIVGTALPRIVESLGGSSLYVWVATAYLVTATVSLPIYARLSDRHGRRSLLLIGITIFLAGSALAATAQNMEQLIAWRALQGLGAGALEGLSFILVADLYSGRRSAALQGALAGLMGVAFIAGPLVGGFLTDHVGWRSVFTVNLPIGIAALAVVATVLPASIGRSERRSTPLDLAGIALLTLGVGLLLIGLNERNAGLMAAATVVIVGFLWVERRAVAPIIPLRLFTDRKVSAILLAGATSTFGLYAGALLLPRYFQQVRDVSATHSGLLIYPLLLGLLLSVNVAGMVIAASARVPRHGPGRSGPRGRRRARLRQLRREHARLAEPDLHGPDRPRDRPGVVGPADRVAAFGVPRRRSAERWARCCSCARSAAPSRWRAPRPCTAPACTATRRRSPPASAC